MRKVQRSLMMPSCSSRRAMAPTPSPRGDHEHGWIGERPWLIELAAHDVKQRAHADRCDQQERYEPVEENDEPVLRTPPASARRLGRAVGLKRFRRAARQDGVVALAAVSGVLLGIALISRHAIRLLFSAPGRCKYGLLHASKTYNPCATGFLQTNRGQFGQTNPPA